MNECLEIFRSLLKQRVKRGGGGNEPEQLTLPCESTRWVLSMCWDRAAGLLAVPPCHSRAFFRTDVQQGPSL